MHSEQVHVQNQHRASVADIDSNADVHAGLLCASVSPAGGGGGGVRRAPLLVATVAILSVIAASPLAGCIPTRCAGPGRPAAPFAHHARARSRARVCVSVQKCGDGRATRPRTSDLRDSRPSRHTSVPRVLWA